MLVLSDIRSRVLGKWAALMSPGRPHSYFVERPGMAIKKEEARRAVLSAYDSWAKKHPSQASMMGGFLFFRYLQTDRSDLLDFRAAGNKWLIVHGWIRD